MALHDAEQTQARLTKKRGLRDADLQAAGRIALAVLFLASAGAKLSRFDETRRAMDDFGFSGSDILLTLAIGIELLGGTLLALGYQTRRTALGLVAYLAVLTTLMCHDWSVDMNRAVAIATLAIIGGLFLLAANGAGTLSLERYLANREAARPA
jgi:putative oxidoreductase